MSITTQVPISESDINILANRQGVALPAAKFKELLAYVEQIEDTMETREFDLSRSEKFNESLLSILTHSLSTIKDLANRVENSEILIGMYNDWYSLLKQQVEEGSLAGVHLKKFEQALSNIVLEGRPEQFHR